MRKTTIIKALHICVFILFIILYFVFEEQDMIGSVMFHVDKTAASAPYRNHALLATTILTAVCCLWGRWSRNLFSITVILLYFVSLSFSLLHGPSEAKGALGYIVMTCAIVLPLLMYIFGYNLPYKISQKVIDRGIMFGMAFMGLFYAITMKSILLNYILHENFRDGTVYVFMMFMPMVMTFKNAKVRNIIIIFIVLAILTSLKRGGFVTILIALFVYLITAQHVSEKKIPAIVKILLFAIAIMAIFAVVIYINTQSEGKIFERFSTASADGGSGRNVVYLIVFEMLMSCEPLQLLIGNGWNSVASNSPLGLSAHNDYLEIAYDVGIIGLFLLLACVIQLGYITHKLVRKKSPLAPAFAASFVIFFFTSMTAHVFLYVLNMSALMLFWGYAIAKINILQKQKTEEITPPSIPSK